MEVNQTFELLDKVQYDFINWDKEVRYADMPNGCSGSPSPYNNDSKIGVIKEIKTIISKGYYFGDYENEEGFYETTTVQYLITGHDKPLNSHSLKKI